MQGVGAGVDQHEGPNLTRPNLTRRNLTRRGVTIGLSLLGAQAAAGGSPAAAAVLPSLRGIAAGRGITFGAQPFQFPPTITPEMEALVAAQCDVIAPVLHWRLMDQGRPPSLDFEADGGVSDFGERLGRQITGVHLLWHEALPAWFADLPDEAKKDAVTRFIRAMGARFSDRFWSVNVVNEILDPDDGLPGGLRRSALTDQSGDTSLFELAFRVAREAFPRSLLVCNEYGLEQDEPGTAAKRAALLAQLDAFQRAGVPIDAVGLQSHLSLGRRFDEAGFARFVQALADRGLLVVLTELDVLDVDAPADIAARDAAVASLYRCFLDAALAAPAVRGVVIWGLSDRDTWLNARTAKRFARPDGLANRPLPFDGELRPKPAFKAIAAALAGAPPRPGFARL